MRRSTALISAATVTAGAVAGRRAFNRRVASWTTNPDPTNGDPLGLPDATPITATAADGATLAGLRCGDPSGPSVLLVHGWIESTGFWGPVAHRLVEAGMDVVLVDQRGHGNSARGHAPYATSTLGADVRQWVETLELTDATLVGHSMGGVAAMAFATDHHELASERLSSLVLVATLAAPPPSRLPDTDVDLERVLRIAERFLRLENVGLFGLLGAFGHRPARAALEVTRRAFVSTDPVTRADAARMLREFDLRPALGSIRLPATVLAGSHDQLTPVESNQEIADLIPAVDIEVVPTKGHMLMFEAPDVVAERILAATKPRSRAL